MYVYHGGCAGAIRDELRWILCHGDGGVRPYHPWIKRCKEKEGEKKGKQSKPERNPAKKKTPDKSDKTLKSLHIVRSPSPGEQA